MHRSRFYTRLLQMVMKDEHKQTLVLSLQEAGVVTIEHWADTGFILTGARDCDKWAWADTDFILYKSQATWQMSIGINRFYTYRSQTSWQMSMGRSRYGTPRTVSMTCTMPLTVLMSGRMMRAFMFPPRT